MIRNALRQSSRAVGAASSAGRVSTVSHQFSYIKSRLKHIYARSLAASRLRFAVSYALTEYNARLII